MNPLFRIDFSISDSLKIVRKSVLIYETIIVSTFYYHVRALRKKACAVPEAVDASAQKQEVVQIPLWETEQNPSDHVALPGPSVCLEMQGIRVEIHEQAGADVIRNTLLALRQLC